MKIRFIEEQLSLFSAASLDFNPLHLSAGYARTTSSGERVVYGMLGFLACLREVALVPERVPSNVRIDFKSPLLLDVDYTISVEKERSGDARFALLDGSASMFRARLQFDAGTPECADLSETEIAPRQQARKLEASDLAQRLSFGGTYGPAGAPYLKLLDALGIDRRTWGDALPLAALCSSYLTGMELPGESATYSGLRLNIAAAPRKTPFAFEITSGSYNPQFGLAQSRFALREGSSIWANGEVSAFVRTPRSVAAALVASGSGRFAGKSALIVGASRGLGAAMAINLIAEGATVIGVYARSDADAQQLMDSVRGLPGTLIMERGDASDLHWCAALKSRLEAKLDTLDLLVCNAAPAIQSLRVEEACYQRIQSYVEKGFALVAAPLSAFLERVAASQGCVLLVSSEAVNEPPPGWPHYVAMKSAVEGLVRTAAIANPKVSVLIARPGKILTDLSDTPLGRLGAETPDAAAQRILGNVLKRGDPGTVQFCS